MPAPVLASDVMDEAASLLNDSAKTLFSYANQLPYLKKAAEDLESILIDLGQSPLQKATSATISVASSASIITVSQASVSDLFVPIHLWERAQGGAIGDWQLMEEKEWEPDTRAGTVLQYWTFRNNALYCPPCTANREVKIDYWRQLTPITSSSSNQEVTGAKMYLAAKTAELCARYIGENKERADQLLEIEVIPSRDRLESIYVKNSQSRRVRRKRFGGTRVSYTR